MSMDAYATIAGLDDLHNKLRSVGFTVKNMDTHLRIYRYNTFCATGKILKVGDHYVPIVFMFDKNYWHIMDTVMSLDIMAWGGMASIYYQGLRTHNRRIIHPKGRIYGFAPLDIEKKDVDEWKEIVTECKNEQL